MEKLIARVQGGHLILNEPTTLPEGTEVPLLVDYDPGELDLTPEQRDALNAVLARSIAEADRGEGLPAADVLSRLRTRE